MNIKIRSFLFVLLVIVSSMVVMPINVSAEESVEPTEEDDFSLYER